MLVHVLSFLYDQIKGVARVFAKLSLYNVHVLRYLARASMPFGMVFSQPPSRASSFYRTTGRRGHNVQAYLDDDVEGRSSI